MASALDALTDAQRDAVTHRGSPLLVIGGPGTGKTEVLVRRLVHLADEGLEPHRILVLSAQEGLRERIEVALERPHEDLALYAFPDFAISLLSAEARHAGINPFVDVLSAAERLAMLLERADELELSHHDFRGRPLALFASFVRRIDTLKAELVDAERYARYADGARGRRAPSVSASSRPSSPPTIGCSRRAACSTRAACSRARVALLRGDGAVCARAAARFPAVLVDGWQDRSAAERELVAALEQGGSMLSAAGDDDQALSRARGAGAANLLALHAPASRRPRGDARRRASAAPSACSTPRTRSWPTPARASARTHSAAAGGEVRFWRAANERAQAQRVAAELEHLTAREQVAPEACAVLVRSLAEEGQAVAVALAERSVPCRIVGAEGFFDRAEVRDVLAWLRLLVDPRDSPAAVRALARPPIELHSADIARCVQISRRRRIDMVVGAGGGDRVTAARARGARADRPLPARSSARSPGSSRTRAPTSSCTT